MSGITGLLQPRVDSLTTIRPLDPGPAAMRGIGRYPALSLDEAYPCLVSAVGDDGNEMAGFVCPM